MFSNPPEREVRVKLSKCVQINPQTVLSALQEFFDDLVVIYASTVQSVKKFGESLLQVHVAFLYRTHARCVSETCGRGCVGNTTPS